MVHRTGSFSEINYIEDSQKDRAASGSENRSSVVDQTEQVFQTVITNPQDAEEEKARRKEKINTALDIGLKVVDMAAKAVAIVILLKKTCS